MSDHKNGAANAPRTWLGAAALTAAGWAAGLLAGLAVVLLAPASGVADDVRAQFGQVLPSGSTMLPWWVQTLPLGYLGSLTAGASISATVPLIVVPLATASAVFFCRTLARPIVAPRQRAAVAAAAAAGYSALVNVPAMVGAVRVPADLAGGPVGGHAVTAASVLASAAVMFAAIFLATTPAGARIVPLRTRQAIRTGAEHLGGYAVVIGVIALILVAVNSDMVAEITPNALLLVPILGLCLLGVGHFSAITAHFPDGGRETLSLFSPDTGTWWTLVALFVTALGLVLAGIRWRLRRGADRGGAAWTTLPLTYGLLGLLAAAYGTVRVDVAGERLLYGLAPWTFLPLAAIGLAVEVIGRYLAAPLYGVLPAAVQRALALGLGPRRFAFDARGEQTTELVVTAASAAGYLPPAPRPPGRVRAPAQAPEPREPRPASARRKRGLLVGALLAVLAIAGSAVAPKVYAHLAETTFGPGEKVENYLQALIDGRASDAVALAGPNAAPDRRVLLSDAVYAAAGNRPTAYRISDVSVAGTTGTVTARVTQNGREYPMRFTFTAEGTQGAIFNDWRIQEAPVSYVLIDRAPEEITVNGVTATVAPRAAIADVTAPDAQGAVGDGSESVPVTPRAAGVLPALPGDYTFAAPAASRYVAYGEDVTVRVTPGGELDGQQPVAFTSVYTPTVLGDAADAVADAIAGCTSPTDALIVTGCEAAAWQDTTRKAMRVTGRSWSAEPVIYVVPQSGDGVPAEQAGPEELTGSLAVVVDAELRLDYQVRENPGEDWEDRHHVFNPFVESDGGSWTNPYYFPIAIEGDTLTVATDAIHRVHEAWMK